MGVSVTIIMVQCWFSHAASHNQFCLQVDAFAYTVLYHISIQSIVAFSNRVEVHVHWYYKLIYEGDSPLMIFNSSKYNVHCWPIRDTSWLFDVLYPQIQYNRILCRRIPGHSSFPLCTVPRQCAVLCGVYTRMWCPLCLFMYGPCAGVLPPYKFTAFQAVNMYGGSALA